MSETSAYNRKALSKVDGAIKKILAEKFEQKLIEIAEMALVDAQVNREYKNLTGNTITSYAAAVFTPTHKPKVTILLKDMDGLEEPTQKKLSWFPGFIDVVEYGTGVKCFRYAGRFTDTSNEYGYETSIRFLNNYDYPSNSYGVVLCTGTEYSVFLEKVRHFNVLTETFSHMPRLLLNNMRKIV